MGARQCARSTGGPLRRRRFDHLIIEISLALNQNLPRYPLWITFKELGMDPEFLTREAVIEFCDEHLTDFLAHLGHFLPPRIRPRPPDPLRTNGSDLARSGDGVERSIFALNSAKIERSLPIRFAPP
jgi:hypothetical protein